MGMAYWVRSTIQGWIYKHKITELTVLVETPILNRSERGVVTMMTQMRMLASYEAVLCDLVDCDVNLGEVHNQTAKAVFTGNGNADKTVMVSNSVWAYRQDVTDRKDLADAQAIGTVLPHTYPINNGVVTPKTPRYEDHNIGTGPKWHNKHPRTRSGR